MQKKIIESAQSVYPLRVAFEAARRVRSDLSERTEVHITEFELPVDDTLIEYERILGSDSTAFVRAMKQAVGRDFLIFIEQRIAEITGWPLQQCLEHTPAREIYLEGILRIKRDCYTLKDQQVARG